MFYYIARWPDSAVFHYVNDAKLESPFIIEPIKYTFDPWELPPPIGHGNQAANRLYGKTVYQGLAQILNWPLLPMEAPLEEAPLYRSVPGGKNWQSELKKYFIEQVSRIPTKFDISSPKPHQIIGTLDKSTGLMGRTSTIWLRRPPGANSIAIQVATLAGVPSFYPLRLQVSIPSDGGGTKEIMMISDNDPTTHQLILKIPEDIPTNGVMDILFEADRITWVDGYIRRGSLYIKEIQAN